MAKQVCENCGRIQEVFGPKIEFTEVNGKLYCEDCAGGAQQESATMIEQSDLTDSQKLTGILNYTIKTYEESKQQTGSLNTIKTIIVLVAVLSVIAAIFQGCSAF